MWRKLFLCMALIGVAAACRSGMRITVNFVQLSGLEKGDRVLFENNAAGSVQSIEYRSDGHYVAALHVSEAYAQALTEHSRFYLVDDPERTGRKAVEIRLMKQGGALLPDGASVTGASPAEEKVSQWQEQLDKGARFLERQIEKFGREIERLPESREYQRLKKSLDEWAAEMERAGEEAREKLEKHWLPKIREELEDLEDWVRRHGPEKEDPTRERDGGRIRNI